MAFSRFAQLRPVDGNAENYYADETRETSAPINPTLSPSISAMLMITTARSRGAQRNAVLGVFYCL